MSFEQIQIVHLASIKEVVPRNLSEYKCRFCLDSQFLFVLPEWIDSGLPKRLSPEQAISCLTPSFKNRAIPCDCHASANKTFSGFFGKAVFGTAYGKALVSIRESRPNI